jgi:hypothetical protein
MESESRPTSAHLENSRPKPSFRRVGLVALATTLGVAGCPTRDKYDPTPAVVLTSPSIAVTYTSGTVHVTAAIDPPLDLPIVLWLDGSIQLATLRSSADTFDWNTITATEGTHMIAAEISLSDRTVTSTAATIIVDRTPPQVVSRTPAPSSTNVAMRAPVQVEFSEPIVLPSPRESAFTLSAGGSPLAAHVDLSVDGTAAGITANDLSLPALPATFSASIASTITDRAGNHLAPPTDDWTWSLPDYLQTAPLPIDHTLPATTHLPQLAMGDDLEPVVAEAAVNITGRGYKWQVRRLDGAQWNMLGAASTDSDSASGGVAVAVGGDHPFVAWRPSGPAPGELDVARWSSSAAWQPLPAITPPSGVSFETVTSVLRVGQDQQPLILWNNGYQSFMARRTDAGWNQTFGAIPVAASAGRVDMIVNDAGAPIVSWIDTLNVGHVSMWADSTWVSAPDVPVMDEAFMALDSARKPMIVAPGGAGVFIVQHLSDGSWDLMSPVQVPPQAKHPKIGAGLLGLPVVAYFDAQTSSIGLVRWTGQAWDGRAFAFAQNAVEQVPQLIVDRYGTAWIGWRDTSNRFNVWMTNY